jgi:hypothetical protein
MLSTSYKSFEHRAIAANVSAELAHAMYNVVRDAQEHGWMPPLKAWASDEKAMISRALESPKEMAAACELLMASDGLMYDEGQINAGISDQRRRAIEAWIFGL